MNYVVIARERITPTASIGFTAANIPTTQVKTLYARLQVVAGQKVNYTIDGTAATTSVGFILPLYSVEEVWGADALSNFRMIDNGTACTVEVVYMGTGD